MNLRKKVDWCVRGKKRLIMERLDNFQMEDELKYIALGQLCDDTRGITYGIVKVGDFIPDGVPVIRGGDIREGRIVFDNDKRVAIEVSQQFQRTILQGGELVINLISEPGHTAIVPDEFKGANVSRDVGVIPLNDSVDHRYVDYYLKSPMAIQWLTSRLQGSVTQKINLGTLRELPIPIVDLKKQQAISHILGTFDGKIELNRRMNETLEAMARTIFKSWFVDFDPVRAKISGELPESICLRLGLTQELLDLFPNRLQDSELGETPEGWGNIKIGDFVDVVDYVANGSFASLKENVTLLDEPGYALYVRTTDHNSNYSGKFRFVDKHAYDFLSKTALDGSEVIISNVGDVGTVFRPPKWLGWPMTLGSNAIALKGIGASHFLYVYFSEPFGQNAIKSIVTGSAQLKFNKTNFRDLEILKPPDEILSVYEKYISRLIENKDLLLAEIRTLSLIRDAVLPKLLLGEMKILEAGGV